MESSLLPVVKPRGRSRARKQNSSRISRVFQRAFEVQLRGLSKGKSLIRTFREEEDDGHQEVVVEMAVEEEEPELSSLSLGQQAMKEAFEQAKRKRDPDETSCDSLTHAGVRVAKKTRGAFRSFEDARAYMRTLGLKSEKEWREWRKSGARPHDIPSRPDKTYASSGWTSYGDFLGYAEGPGSRGSFRTFQDARTYVRTLGLKSYREWEAWSKSGARPHDIPSRPDTTYASSGWTLLGDFLGYAEGQGARGSFRAFEDARTYVRTLGLKSQKEWREWRKSGARPHDIPSSPDKTYASSGWISYPDFLGYAEGQGARGSFRAFEDARAYVRTLGLKSQKEWEAWSKSDKRPHDIPSAPNRTYASSGWTSYPDFLGYAEGQGARGSFRSFEDARAYMRTLGLKSEKEWREWRKSGARPHDIPSNPDKTYESSGWTALGDFLGYADGKVAGSFRSFEDARTYARTLGLKSKEEWEAWSSSDARPHDIPSAPNVTYKSSGWTLYGDFLGYAVGNVAGSFRSFADARTYARTLGLKSQKEWEAWSKSGARPHNMPSNPQRTYASSGWTSWGDFLGYAEGQCARGSFRSFEDARVHACTLGLKSQKEWEAWSKSGKRPHDIPSAPNRTYASSGWTSYPDFLGYAEGQCARGSFRSFEDARVHARTLGLKSQKEWRAWSSSGARPHDIPSNPDKTYKSSGWLSYGDFLGFADGKVAGSFRSFADARAYVRTLGLKSQKEWEAWSSSGARPHDIPSNPNVTYKSSGWTSFGDFLG
ncbi:methyltransferase domain-containing protein [Pycnococcus provasolii]